jgi:hypothetical protein
MADFGSLAESYFVAGQSDPPFHSDRLHVSIEDVSAKFSTQKYVRSIYSIMCGICMQRAEERNRRRYPIGQQSGGVLHRV